MARKIKHSVNLDKLRLCYRQPDHFIEGLLEKVNGDTIDYGDFSMKFIELENEDGRIRQLQTIVLLPDGDNYIQLGKLTIYNTAKYEGKCFFTAENRALYHKTGSTLDGRKVNLISYLPYVTDTLGLQFNNFTEVEIALDTNINIIKVIRQFISNSEEYDMFLNGNKIKDEKRHLRHYVEPFGRTRKRLDRYPTINIKQPVVSGIPLHLTVYDKTLEMEEESKAKKEYIEPWNDFGKEKIFRLEVTLPSEDYRQWLRYLQSGNSPYPEEWGNPDEQVSLLLMDEYKLALWDYCATRMLFFRRKKGKVDVTLADIICGAKP